MKTSVIVLTLFGLIAAVSAAVLVRTMVGRPAPIAKVDLDPEVTLLTASKPLAMMTVVDANSIVTKSVRKSALPLGAMTNSVQVVGKVLTRPMVEGEVFAPSCFANDGMGMYLAAALPPGKRAFSISLRDHTGLAGILYPGSVVDVLVSLEKPGSGNQGISTTLLQGIQVMGIGSQTVASEQDFEDKNPGALASKGQMNHRMVTVLVTPKQAEILQLATQYGMVALTMRNPLDNEPVAQQLTRTEEFIGSNSGFGGQMAQWANAFMKNRAEAAAKSPSAAPDIFATASAPSTQPASNPLWEMLVVRGNTTEKRSFPLSEVDQTLGVEPTPAAPRKKAEPAASVLPAPSAKG